MFLGSHGAVPDTEPANLFLDPPFQRAAALQDGICSELGGRKPRLNQPTPPRVTRHQNSGHVGNTGAAGHQLPVDPRRARGWHGATQNQGRRLRRQWVTPVRGRGCPAPAETPSRLGSGRSVTLSFPFSVNNGVLCSGARKSPAAARGAGEGELGAAPAFLGSVQLCRAGHRNPSPRPGQGEKGHKIAREISKKSDETISKT